MKKRSNTLSLAIGALIGTVISVYAAGQRGIYTEAHSINIKPMAEIRVIEVKEVHVVECTEAPEVIEETTYFDVPLSHELQDYIFSLCEEHGIASEIVISMIQQESSFDASAVGDAGCSKGLMQIQQKWHEERMERLGCDDLLDPFQNVTVGIDYLAELMDRNSGLQWVLMAYNGGASYANRRIESGNISDYAKEVAERAAELERK